MFHVKCHFTVQYTILYMCIFSKHKCITVDATHWYSRSHKNVLELEPLEKKTHRQRNKRELSDLLSRCFLVFIFCVDPKPLHKYDSMHQKKIQSPYSIGFLVWGSERWVRQCSNAEPAPGTWKTPFPRARGFSELGKAGVTGEWWRDVPARELTYTTWGIGKSSTQKYLWKGIDMLVSRRAEWWEP